MRFTFALFVTATIVIAQSLPVTTQVSPTTLPRVQASDIRYLGSFAVPPIDDGVTWRTENALTYGGFALGKSANGLYFGCHDWLERLAEISIPAIGGTASVLRPCTSVPGLGQIDQDQINLGGTLLWNGRLIVSAYAYYDGDGNATKSHFAGTPSIGGFSSPTTVGTAGAGRVGGYMGVIPDEWRGLLGGPAFTGQCCIGIISRSSWGPSLSVFNPDSVGSTSPVPATQLVGYNTAATALADHASTGDLFNGSTQMGGVAFPAGTRSVIFFGRHGTGPYCYGTGAECGDPEDGSKGTHAYPYRRQAWFYDASDLAKVKAGQLQPYQVRPYAVVPLPGAGGRGARVPQTTYDPVTRRVYMADAYHEEPKVHVYEIGSGAPTPPPPPPPEVCGDGIDNDGDGQVDEGCAPAPVACTVSSWSSWQPVGSWSACASGTQSRTEQRTRTVVTPAANGGAACPALAESRVVSQACQAPATPVACVVSSWSAWQATSAWSACSADGTQSRSESRSRSITTPAANGGAACPVLQESRSVMQACAPAPRPELCGDNLDNDGDGEIDEDCPEPPEPIPGPPANLTARVQGSTVTLNWLAPITGGTPTAYTIEAGLASRETLYSLPVSPSTSAQMPNVAPGHYYVRVRASNVTGIGPASNEVPLTVGCTGAPNRLEQFVARLRSRVVTFAWVDPNGCSDTSYRVSIGSAPGAANLGRLTSDTSSITALAAPGRYYARATAVSRFGESQPSDEVEVVVLSDTCAPAQLPLTLTARTTGWRVSLRWNPTDTVAALTADGVAPLSYVLEVGSAPGTANLMKLNMGRATSFTAAAPPGTYYIRVRTLDICGLGGASNEAVVRVR